MAECSESNYFDLQKVYDLFNQSLIEQHDIDIAAYLKAYNELSKFFELMGSVFSFVSKDLKEKIQILENLYGDNNENYATMNKMIEYEKTNNLFNTNDFINGCRTLLRLHRGLHFILEFLQKLSELDDESTCTNSCQDAYSKTLAKHHSWIVRKAAIYAMYTMPTRGILLQKVCGDQVERNMEVLPKMMEVTNDVMKRTQSAYETNEITDLK